MQPRTLAALSDNDNSPQSKDGNIEIDLDAYCTLGKHREQRAKILANVGKTFGHLLDAVLALAVYACKKGGNLPFAFVGKLIETSSEDTLIYAAHRLGIRILKADNWRRGLQDITTACAVKI